MNTKKYIVELEHNCYSADWAGDPGRTTVKENAKIFNQRGAIARLSHDRKFRPFKNARILEVGEIK